MSVRENIRVAAVAAVVLAGIGGAPMFGAAPMASVTTAVATLVWVAAGRWARTRLAAVTCVAAAVSLAVTVATLAGLPLSQEAGMFGLTESVTLMVLAGLTVRWSPVRQAAVAGAFAGLASAVWLLRFIAPSSLLEAVGACAFWSAGTMIAAGTGAYLRSLDARRARAVADGRAALRLQLAGDLHDFVAHDISEMVAHAQAGRTVGPGDPGQALAALERIERAGQRAMSALDRTVLMLHGDELATTSPLPGLAELSGLAERFAAAGRARVRVNVDPDLEETVPRETAATAFRIVSESLTNVRRHAPDATLVDVTVTMESAMLVVTVNNDGVTGPDESGRGGFGLPVLADHLRSLGGLLHAGPVPGGWSLTARIPLAP
ncbi:sensor histidine kinase [Streptosporangium longisporum]|uniref:sensor histidine kinase n=1 Tax=Streptosporangium longisporum TaxID=46187 RepID=UPI0031E92FB4